MSLLVAGAVGLAVALLLPGWGARRPGGARGGRVSFGAISALVRRPRPGRAASARRTSALRWLDAVVAELRAGRGPRDALVIPPSPPCPRAIAAVALGGDVALALRADAHAQRLPLLAHVAACWAMGETSGAGLATSLDQVLSSARGEEEVRAEVRAQLAGPRATARLLAVLPLLGLLLGTALGANPVGWLLGSPVGWATLVTGVAAAALGVWWTGRMVASVERELDGAR